jgi:hypothetical protein
VGRSNFIDRKWSRDGTYHFLTETLIFVKLKDVKITIIAYYFCLLMLAFAKTLIKLLQLKLGWRAPYCQAQALLKVNLL